MTAAAPIHTQGQAFYVPQFEVRVGKDPAALKLVRDVIEVTFREEVNTIDSFELTLNNWDAGRAAFKFEPPASEEERIFEPERYVEIHMGYPKDLALMTRGIITTIEPNYPESGAPTLAIRGHNLLHKFRRQQHSASWEDKGDSTIAKEIGNSPVSETKPGLGNVPVRIDAARAQEEPREHVEMQMQYDIEFLLDRAKQRGYVLYVELLKGGKEQLYFGPSDQPARIEYELKWGLSLLSFRPTLSTAHQVASVTVRGRDAQVGPVEGTAIFPRDCKLNEDLPAPPESHEVVHKPPARSKQEAKRKAVELLVEHRRKLVTASGSTVGLPHLRAGSYVHIRLAKDSRFNGRYFVTGTTHTVGSGGYTTTFQARREAPLPKGAPQ
jgi:uncharacterized protein